jgi:hypothetical protein
MPARDGLRPLKAWRYLGVFGNELMLCVAQARVGPARQSFWAVWDRRERRLYERTRVVGHQVKLSPGRARVLERDVQLELTFEETAGVECICACGESYGWTRKQGGIPVRGRLMVDGRAGEIDGYAVIDDTAAYYPRHTSWKWSAGVGTDTAGRALAWNLVSGVNDPPASSERTVWIDGDPSEAPPVEFAADLSSVGALRFAPEASRAREENLLLIRSRYRQPFGTFSGSLPGGVELASGFGVMESHDAWW